MHLVIHDDAVVVVDDLALVTELDGFPEPALGDRAGIAVVQTDHPAGAVGGGPGDPLPGLLGDLGGGVQQGRQVVDGAGQPSAPPPRGGIAHSRLGQLGSFDLSAAQRPSCVVQQTLRVPGRGPCQVGELPGYSLHTVFDLVTTQLAAGPQFRRDPVRAFPGSPRPVPQFRAHRATRSLDPSPAAP